MRRHEGGERGEAFWNSVEGAPQQVLREPRISEEISEAPTKWSHHEPLVVILGGSIVNAC